MTEPPASDETIVLFCRMIPTGDQEDISSNSALSLSSLSSSCTGNIVCTLANAKEGGHTKEIITQGGANLTVNCTLESPSTGFSLSANNRVQMVWDNRPGNDFWRPITNKGLTLIP